ncbi:MAG: SufD family Fe-S cluster assembly protein [Candidatus Nanohaloarchaea archaeon]|nr:SufD family Fe-S cluster assembly protein [Candidatus Nanohaloarchaea archaeon]
MTTDVRPDSVRTPGRTWTEFPVEPGEQGHGTVAVTAPDEVTIRTAVDADLFRQIDADRNAVTARHATALDLFNTVVVEVPDGEAVEEPVRIATRIEEGFFPHHVIVDIGDAASATVVEENRGSGVMDAGIVEVHAGDAADLTYRKYNALEGGTGYADAHATVGADATINWLVVSTGADLYRSTVETVLAGPRSRLDYRLGFLSAGEQHMDHTARVAHAADNTACDIDARGVALDASRAVYKGVQEVEEGAEGTESYQDERTVLIGEEAEADTTPQLRIDNHDVEATHAATTGHVNEKDLFYMQSRGLTDAAAKRSIITGMFDDLAAAGDARDLLHGKIDAALR